MKLFRILTIAALAGAMVSCSNEMLTDDVLVINEKVNTKSVQEPLSVPEISKLMSIISYGLHDNFWITFRFYE